MPELTVYVAMAADILHIGHINIIKEAAKLGRVTVGVLSDEAVAGYKRVPLVPYEQRVQVVESLSDVYSVVKQNTLSYKNNLFMFKPDYIVHGNDWTSGPQSETRQEVVEVLKQWGGKLVEVPYTKGISSTQLINAIKAEGITPEQRRNSLRTILKTKKVSRFMEAHNGLTGIIVEKVKHNLLTGGIKIFDGIWISSLTLSTSKGKPEPEVVCFSTRVCPM